MTPKKQSSEGRAGSSGKDSKGKERSEKSERQSTLETQSGAQSAGNEQERDVGSVEDEGSSLHSDQSEQSRSQSEQTTASDNATLSSANEGSSRSDTGAIEDKNENEGQDTDAEEIEEKQSIEGDVDDQSAEGDNVVEGDDGVQSVEEEQTAEVNDDAQTMEGADDAQSAEGERAAEGAQSVEAEHAAEGDAELEEDVPSDGSAYDRVDEEGPDPGGLVPIEIEQNFAAEGIIAPEEVAVLQPEAVVAVAVIDHSPGINDEPAIQPQPTNTDNVGGIEATNLNVVVDDISASKDNADDNSSLPTSGNADASTSQQSGASQCLALGITSCAPLMTPNFGDSALDEGTKFKDPPGEKSDNVTSSSSSSCRPKSLLISSPAEQRKTVRWDRFFISKNQVGETGTSENVFVSEDQRPRPRVRRDSMSISGNEVGAAGTSDNVFGSEDAGKTTDPLEKYFSDNPGSPNNFKRLLEASGLGTKTTDTTRETVKYGPSSLVNKKIHGKKAEFPGKCEEKIKKVPVFFEGPQSSHAIDERDEINMTASLLNAPREPDQAGSELALFIVTASFCIISCILLRNFMESFRKN